MQHRIVVALFRKRLQKVIGRCLNARLDLGNLVKWQGQSWLYDYHMADLGICVDAGPIEPKELRVVAHECPVGYVYVVVCGVKNGEILNQLRYAVVEF